MKSPSPFASIEKERGFVKLRACDVLFYSVDLVDKFHTAVHTVIVSGEGVVIFGYGRGSFHTIDHFLKFIGIHISQFADGFVIVFDHAVL